MFGVCVSINYAKLIQLRNVFFQKGKENLIDLNDLLIVM